MLKHFELFKKAILSCKAIQEKKAVDHSISELQEQKKMMMHVAIAFAILTLVFLVFSLPELFILVGLSATAMFGWFYWILRWLISSKAKEVK